MRLRLRVCLTLLAALLSWSALAADLAAAIDLRSDYRFRGLDQTNGFAARGGADVDFDAVDGYSPYLGGFVAGNRMAGGSEVDLYSGFTHAAQFSEILPYTVDAGVVGYLFPQSDDGLRHRDLNSAELYAGLAAGPLALKAWLAPDYFGSGAPGAYFRGTLKWPLSPALSAFGSGGLALGPGLRRYTEALTADHRGASYADTSLGLEYAWHYGLTLRAELSATTLDLGPQATGGSGRFGALIGLRKDFDLGRR